MNKIYAVTIPKWGLSMEEGMLLEWHVEEGDYISIADEVVDIETSKVTNTVDSAHAGILRRKTANLGETYSCGTLIAVIAEEGVSESAIDEFVTNFTITSISGKYEVDEDKYQSQKSVVRGKELRYLQMGESSSRNSDPVLFIHGYAGDLNNWLFIQPKLSVSRITYAIDLPGHGASTKDISGLEELPCFAELLFSFLDHLGLQKVRLVAHSMGSIIALDMARSEPDRIVSMSLLNPAGIGFAVNKYFLAGLISSKTRRDVSRILKMLFANPNLVSREMVDDLLKYKRLDGVEAVLSLLADKLDIEDQSSHVAFRDISMPVQLICGEADEIIRIDEKLGLPDNIEFTRLLNVGHMPHLEDPAEVAKTIENFWMIQDGQEEAAEAE